MGKLIKITEITETELQDIPVMYVVAQGGPAGATWAFAKLEKALGTLRGRKFYGTFHNGDYRANVAINTEDNPEALGFLTGKIPGGKYARKRIKYFNYLDLGRLIPTLFEEMRALYANRVDFERPSIEFYRRVDDLLLFLPIK